MREMTKNKKKWKKSTRFPTYFWLTALALVFIAVRSGIAAISPLVVVGIGIGVRPDVLVIVLVSRRARERQRAQSWPVAISSSSPSPPPPTPVEPARGPEPRRRVPDVAQAGAGDARAVGRRERGPDAAAAPRGADGRGGPRAARAAAGPAGRLPDVHRDLAVALHGVAGLLGEGLGLFLFCFGFFGSMFFYFIFRGGRNGFRRSRKNRNSLSVSVAPTGRRIPFSLTLPSAGKFS